jgi:hypothetical protein
MIERRRPPAWDPLNLLLVVSRLLLVVRARRVVVVVAIGGGSWLRGSIIWLRQMDKGRKRKQSKHEYSSEVLSKQGSTLHMQHFQRRAEYVD